MRNARGVHQLTPLNWCVQRSRGSDQRLGIVRFLGECGERQWALATRALLLVAVIALVVAPGWLDTQDRALLDWWVWVAIIGGG